jgi:DNA-binding transcriptional regulator YdaS (Cro superfamily)
MSGLMSTASPLIEAIKAAGGQSAAARLLGVSQSLIAQWVARDRDTEARKGRPLPAEYCPALESATGVRCERLLPDVIWTRGQAGEVTGYHVPLAPTGRAA